MDKGLSSSYLLLKSLEKETFLRDCQLREGSGLFKGHRKRRHFQGTVNSKKGMVSCVIWGSGIRAHDWKQNLEMVDISGCVIFDGLINPMVLAWLMISC